MLRAVERVVEQVAVADREGRGPVEVREDAEGHRLAPAAHQQRPDEAEHEVQPDRRGERPGDVGAHAQRPGAGVHAHPPQQDRGRQAEAGEQPPAALGASAGSDSPCCGPGGSSAEPGTDARTGAGSSSPRPSMLSPMISMAMKPKQRGDAGVAEIERPDLRVAELAARRRRTSCPGVPKAPLSTAGTPGRHRSADLHAGEDVLIFSHGHCLPPPFSSRSAG
jgi:hypothetical protein